MISLYLDTSCKYLCIGIAKDYQIIYKYQQESFKKQSEMTIPELKKALEYCHFTLKDIDEINVTKVLASINKIPLKTISSLNACASIGKKIVILDAKANRVYLGIYNNNQKIIDECVVEIETLKEMLKQYLDYDVVLDSYLINKESDSIDIIENMNRISKTIKPIDDVDNLIPIYLKDR